MTAAEKLLAAGYDDVVILENYSYDDALIGVTDDNRAVYDFNKMVCWLVSVEGMETIAAIEWIEYNTIQFAPWPMPGMMHQSLCMHFDGNREKSRFFFGIFLKKLSKTS